MTNVNGKWYALNVVTPMKPWKTLMLRLVFVLVALRSKQSQLRQLSFIHFARWAILDRRRLPRVDDAQPAEDLRHDYLLFFSNFNGTWDEYVEAFSAVLAADLNKLWRWSERFPMTYPLAPFKRYIARMQVDTDYYYAAYPSASASEVKAALRVQDAVGELARTAGDLAPADFERAWLRFLVQVQGDLGAAGPAPA
jgi:hypothetical protein